MANFDANYVSRNESCYVVNQRSNRTFKLIWQDEFDKKENWTANWIVTDETRETCNGNGIGQISCNVAKNVQIIKDNLVLFAKHEKYLERSFTAATLTTRDSFTHGRIEIRASLPLGRQIRSSFFTQNDTNQKTWHDNGQIDLMTRYDNAALHRVVHYANSSILNRKLNLYENLEMESGKLLMRKQNDEFHVYGVEWDDQEVMFFLDEQYSVDSVVFDKVHEALATHHQIRLQIGVGGSQDFQGYFQQPIPTDFDDFNWQCPATIIDYIRIFEKVENLQEITELAQCNQTNKNDNERKIIDSICEIAMEGIEIKFMRNYLKNNWKVILLVTFICLVLIVIVYIFVQIFAMKRRLSQTPEPANRESSREERIYDVPIYQDNEPSSSNLNQTESRSYLDLHDVKGRSYLSLKDVVNSGSNEYLPIWTTEKDNQKDQNDKKKLKQNGSREDLVILKTSDDKSYDVTWSKKATSTEHLSRV